MNIDKAIARLQELKTQGHTHLIIGFWEKEDVEQYTAETITDEHWKNLSDYIEDNIDWSDVNEQIETGVQEAFLEDE